MGIPRELLNVTIFSREGQPVRYLVFTDELRRLLHDQHGEPKQATKAAKRSTRSTPKQKGGNQKCAA